jgi:hypothetical protein
LYKTTSVLVKSCSHCTLFNKKPRGFFLPILYLHLLCIRTSYSYCNMYYNTEATVSAAAFKNVLKIYIQPLKPFIKRAPKFCNITPPPPAKSNVNIFTPRTICDKIFPYLHTFKQKEGGGFQYKYWALEIHR